jgi:hypothetical protein
MKKAFFIIVLALMFNLSTPSTVIIQQKLRHSIEYSQGSNTRIENENDFLKKKAIFYLKLESLKLQFERINFISTFYINTS